MEVTEHQVGMLSWADLTTPDLDASRKFYTSLLDLEYEDAPVAPGVVYTMLKKNGKAALAMSGPPGGSSDASGGPAYWRAYFTVENTDDTAEKARSLGGKIVAGPLDVFTAGRMAVISDPAGAQFAVWQPRDEIGAHVFAEPGALCWAELWTNDTSAATDFYSALFGWTANVNKSPTGADYTMFSIGGRPAVGMLAIQPEWGDMPPIWSIYVGTEDLDASIAKAKSMGANAYMDIMQVPGIGKFTALHDPHDGIFTLMEFAGAPPAH